MSQHTELSKLHVSPRATEFVIFVELKPVTIGLLKSNSTVIRFSPGIFMLKFTLKFYFTLGAICSVFGRFPEFVCQRQSWAEIAQFTSTHDSIQVLSH